MRTLLILSAPLLALGLTACVDDEGPHSMAYAEYGPAAYDGWYDGYYGNVYDGYWGDDGFFYYRVTDHDREFRRGDRDHFRHDQTPPSGNFQHLQGTFNPTHDYHMPHYPHGRR